MGFAWSFLMWRTHGEGETCVRLVRRKKEEIREWDGVERSSSWEREKERPTGPIRSGPGRLDRSRPTWASQQRKGKATLTPGNKLLPHVVQAGCCVVVVKRASEGGRGKTGKEVFLSSVFSSWISLNLWVSSVTPKAEEKEIHWKEWVRAWRPGVISSCKAASFSFGFQGIIDRSIVGHPCVILCVCLCALPLSPQYDWLTQVESS